MSTTVRISELPETTSLDDRDLLVINTSNLVTQGIMVPDFVTGFCAKDLFFAGNVSFASGKQVEVDSLLKVDGVANFNESVTFQDDVTFNGTHNLRIQDMNDYSGTPLDGQALVWNNQAQEWRPQIVQADLSSLTLDEVTKNGHITTNNIVIGGLKVGTLNYPNSDGSANHVLATDGLGNVGFLINNIDRVLRNGNSTAQKIRVGELQVNNLKYPNNDGAPGDSLVTDGNGNLTFSPVQSGGATIPFQPSPPSSPNNQGDLWMNSTNYNLYVYDGAWINTTGSTGQPGGDGIEQIIGLDALETAVVAPKITAIDFDLRNTPFRP